MAAVAPVRDLSHLALLRLAISPTCCIVVSAQRREIAVAHLWRLGGENRR